MVGVGGGDVVGGAFGTVGGAFDVVGVGGGDWVAGAGGCCCREVER